MANLNKSVGIDAQNIQGLVDKGNALYHTPTVFWGNKTEALKMFLKSMKLIEHTGISDQNCFYLNVLTLIGKAYEKLEKPIEARLTYEKILRLEPNYKLVKNKLYPNIILKIKN
ncbi:MAG: hypothetical protein GZ091_13435 [Paludibacter sp.]|nr:hypothetical protein [Paludibacter sp.]